MLLRFPSSLAYPVSNMNYGNMGWASVSKGPLVTVAEAQTAAIKAKEEIMSGVDC